MKFQHGIIENIPTNFKPILDRALELSFESWVDEKGTKKFPSAWRRNKKMLTDGKPDACVGFLGNSSKNMLKLAQDVGIPIRKYYI